MNKKRVFKSPDKNIFVLLFLNSEAIKWHVEILRKNENFQKSLSKFVVKITLEFIKFINIKLRMMGQKLGELLTTECV